VIKDFLNDQQFWNKITGNILKSFPDTVVEMQKLFDNKTPTLDDLKTLVNKRLKEVEAAGKSAFGFMSSKPNETTLAFYKCIKEATDFKSISGWILLKKAEFSPPAAATPAPKKQ
jgi:hypothetical protein